MAADTDVVNIAARRIGQTPITSLTDGSPMANAADDIYADTRDSLLRSHNWNFATKRVQLAQSATAPGFEFDHAYTLPADWIRTVSVHDNDAGHGTILFRMEQVASQRCIVTSSDEVWLRYVARVTDPNLMTDDFRYMLAVKLARDLAIPMTSSNTLYEELSSEFKTLLAQARSTDAMGSFPELRPRGSWASSRGGRRRNDFLSD